MTLPKSLAELPDHQVLPRSASERAALPDVQWEAFTAPTHQHLRSTNAVGVWHIGHPTKNVGGYEPVELAYQLPFDQGADRASVSAKLNELDTENMEWWRLEAMTHRQELGRVFDQEYAKVFVDRARRLSPDASPEELLLAAGFVFAHEINDDELPTRVFRQGAGDGFFSVFLSDRSFWLTHEKNNAQHWTNLLSFNTCEKIDQDACFVPRFMSPEVVDPIAACADMAGYFVKQWTPAGEPEKQPTKRPSI